MHKTTRLVVSSLLLMPLAALAGNLDNAGAPSAGSGMPTTTDIYNRLDIGADITAPGAFKEPPAGAITGTSRTLAEIQGKLPVPDNTNGAVAGDVLAGKTFWGLRTDGTWGHTTGLAVAPTLGSNITGSIGQLIIPIPDGLYVGGKTATANDSHLTTGNIRSGMTIFGVSGSPTVVDTVTGTAVAADIVSGKTAFVNGSQVTGSVTAGSNVTGGNAQLIISIPDGLYSGRIATASDTSLVSGNIKSGATIFGVGGSVIQATGSATTANVLSGVTFSNAAGADLTGTMPNQGAASFTPAAFPVSVPAGYYSGGQVNTDANLVSGNIKSGATIFGVAGSSKVLDTSSGTATATDIVSGKTAFVNGSLITGSVTAGSNVTGSNGQLTATIPDGIYSGSKTATVSDTNLASGNIKSGTTIFGVAGSSKVLDTSAGTAVAGDIYSGKVAFVNGSQLTGTMPVGSNVSGGNAQLIISIPDAYYSGRTATASDTNLLTGNIKSGVTIFGVAGSSKVLDTSAGTAATSDIVSGKIAFVNGSQITGSAYPAPVAKTGQTISYGTNDDGARQKGVAWPNPRFTNNGNGTVTDNLTGLIWLRNANCANGTRDWNTALSDVSSLNGSGNMNGNNCGDTSNGGSHQTDWRLPNVKELQSLVDYAYSSPALSNATGTGQWVAGDPFTNVQTNGYYYSGSSYSSGLGNAWGVHMGLGSVYENNKTGSVFVWPVRGGQ